MSLCVGVVMNTLNIINGNSLKMNVWQLIFTTWNKACILSTCLLVKLCSGPQELFPGLIVMVPFTAFPSRHICKCSRTMVVYCFSRAANILSHRVLRSPLLCKQRDCRVVFMVTTEIWKFAVQGPGGRYPAWLSTWQHFFAIG